MTARIEPVPAEINAHQEPDVMDLLQEHVPLALLCDLSTPDGPHSAEILAEEGQPTDAWWKQ